MIPRAPEALRMLSQRILSHLVPDTRSPYSMSDGAMVGMLMVGLVKELESGIERRLADIREMKAVLSRATESLPPAVLPEGIDRVLALAPSSMTMGDVNACHDEHARVLIALHDRVDVDGADDAKRAINQVIWAYLRAYANRHTLDI